MRVYISLTLQATKGFENEGMNGEQLYNSDKDITNLGESND
jgi:hypothetical protein